MIIISFINPKGGAGKTTCANLLATGLAKRGAKTLLFETDKRSPQLMWVLTMQHRKGEISDDEYEIQLRQGKKRHRVEKAVTDNFTVLTYADSDEVIPTIKWARAQGYEYVIVDTEGAGDLATTDAMSMSTMVVLPSQASKLDADGASDAIQVIENAETKYRAKFPLVSILTRTNPAIRTKILKNLIAELDEAGIPTLPSEVNDREPFRTMYEYGYFLEELDEIVTGDTLKKAIDNADDYVEGIIHHLKNTMSAKEAV